MARKVYEIKLEGCDDQTVISKDLTPTQAKFIQELAKEINEASEYGCQPVMIIREGKMR